MSEWQEEECDRNWLSLAWHSRRTPEVLHCAGSGQGPLSALLGQSQAEISVLERRCLLGCTQWQFFRRGNRELVGFPDPAWDGQTWFTPRDEWTLLLRGTAEIGSWGFRALLGYPGFANLPANSKQPPKPCTAHRALPRSTALPSIQGRHQHGDSPAGGLGAASPAAAGAAQAVPATGRGSPPPNGVYRLTPGCASPKRWVLNHANQQDAALGSTTGTCQGFVSREMAPAKANSD